jgi:hypothetical protein
MRKKIFVYFIVQIFIILSLFSSQISVAKGSKALARIVVASAATEAEKYAAGELSQFLHLTTGARFTVTSETESKESCFLVGADAARQVEPDFSTLGLEPEEIIIRTKGKDLILAGGSPRGTFYAVSVFLEDILGCRFWSYQATHIPWKPTLKIPPLDLRYKPPFEYREPFWHVAFDPAWAARNRANGVRAGGDPHQGGRHVYEGFVHTFYNLIAPEKYYLEHPEWFSEINGQRTTEKSQLCLTNEEMRQELVRNLKEKLRLNPLATIASVSQNDCFNNCTCPKCRAVDEEEGSPSGSLLRFVNAVAADIEKEFPQVAIDTLAYQYTRKPCRITRPRQNVIIRLCTIECSFSRPLDNQRNISFFEDLAGWSKIAERLYIWDYTTDFSHYIQPHPNFPVLAPNIRLFQANKVRGIFEQGAYQSSGSEMAELRAWILAKLLWNPTLDPLALRHEFLKGYYGPAGKHILSYLQGLERQVIDRDDYLGCYSPPDAKFLSFPTLQESWTLLKKAEKSVKGKLTYSRRVRLAQLPVLYVVITRWEELTKEASEQKASWPWPKERQELLDWFLKVARAENVSQISEWQMLEDWAAKGGNVQ